MPQGILRRVLLSFFFLFSAAFGMRCHPQSPAVVLEHNCAHQNRFFIENFRFLVPMFFKRFENEIFGLKSVDLVLFFM